ncbi:MAG: AgmX/PglI C-terminal domain-containing protein [Proteobacteria bacterium]|nr:AgmX/PglI C-terminal domain-containing protein [Pseudomonadota bacterium]
MRFWWIGICAWAISTSALAGPLVLDEVTCSGTPIRPELAIIASVPADSEIILADSALSKRFHRQYSEYCEVKSTDSKAALDLLHRLEQSRPILDAMGLLILARLHRDVSENRFLDESRTYWELIDAELPSDPPAEPLQHHNPTLRVCDEFEQRFGTSNKYFSEIALIRAAALDNPLSDAHNAVAAKKALEALLDSSTRNGVSRFASLRLGQLALDDGDFAAAATRFAPLAESDGDFRDGATYEYAWCKYYLGNIDSAKKVIYALLDRENEIFDQSAVSLLGRIYADQEGPLAELVDEARDHRKGLESLWVAAETHRYYGEYEQAKALLEALVQQWPQKAADLEATIASFDQESTTELSELQAARRAFNRHLPTLRRCYEARLTENPSLKGRLGLKLSVAAGTVQAVEKTADTTIDNELWECFEQRIKTWTFPENVEGDIEIPLALYPE